MGFIRTFIRSLNGLTETEQIITTGSSGTSPNVSQSGSDTNIINIPNASTSGVTSGLISNTSYLSFTKSAEISEQSTVGVTSGGLITRNSGFDINVTAGTGFLLDSGTKKITWSSAILTIPANSTRYIYVDTNSVVQQSGAIPSFTTAILLGRVTSDASSIRSIEDAEMDMRQLGNILESAFRRILGPLFVSGAIVTENGTRQLDITAGSYFLGLNEFILSGGTAITWKFLYQNGIGGWTEGTQSTVDNANYDDSSGTLAPLSAGFYAKHTLYTVDDPDGDKYFLVYSQDQYASLDDAENAPFPTTPSFLTDAIVRVAEIIVRQGQSNIQEILDTRPKIDFSAAAVFTPSDHGNLTGLLDDDHPQYLLVSGTRAMTGNLNIGGQSITNVNLVDGVDIPDHSSRHDPSGADPLSTAAPSANLSATSTNAEGVANSFSRSDHSHAIDAASANTAGALVKRDGSGNFSAGTITATLNGTATNVSGIVAIANGGTNSSTALNNNRIIQSSGGAIVEAAAITANRALKSDANGIPVASTATSTSLDALSGTNTGDQTITLTGDVTGSGTSTFAATIANDAVTNAKLANMSTQTIKGRTTAGSGDPEDLTATQATAILNNFVGDSGSGGTKGLVPAPASGDAAASKFLKADGTWQVVTDTGITQLTGDVTAGPGNGSQVATITNDAVTNAKLANMATSTFKGRTTAGTGDPEDLTVSQAKTLLDLTGTNSGDQTITLTGDVTGSGTGSFAATIATGAVTDTKGSLANKPTMGVVASSNLTLSGEQTIDGILTSGTLVLAMAQSSGSQNGPWLSSAGAWTRPTWYPSGGTTQAFQFISTMIRLGTVYAGSFWRMTTAGAITIDTTSTAWAVVPRTMNSSTVVAPIPVDIGGTGQTSYTNGQLLIGNTSGNTLTKATLTAGTGISITNGTGSITVATTGLATSSDVQVFTGNGTWTKPSGAKAVDVIAVGAGGGGGSGSATASGATAIGGAGGGGAVMVKKTYNASDLGSTVSITVGTAGTAGTAVGPGASAGVSGGIGGTSSFGTLLTAYGGGGGSQGVTSTSRSAGSGAGTAGAGGTGAAAAVNGGLPNTGNGVGIAGGGGGVGGTNDVGQPSESGGGAGGGTTGSAAGQNGGTSIFSCGGGAGGGSTNTTTTPQAGGTGGGINTYIAAGGGGGTAGTAAGGTGGNGTSGLYNGSGGGGGGAAAANNTTNGGGGGTGGTYGGGGGGGGACRSGGTAVSGAGGAGGAGVVIVISYF